MEKERIGMYEERRRKVGWCDRRRRKSLRAKTKKHNTVNHKLPIRRSHQSFSTEIPTNYHDNAFGNGFSGGISGCVSDEQW